MKMTLEIAEYLDPKTNSPCEVEMYIDNEAITDLVSTLLKLTDLGDDAHFMTPEWGMYNLSGEKINERNNLVHHLKITLI